MKRKILARAMEEKKMYYDDEKESVSFDKMDLHIYGKAIEISLNNTEENDSFKKGVYVIFNKGNNATYSNKYKDVSYAGYLNLGVNYGLNNIIESIDRNDDYIIGLIPIGKEAHEAVEKAGYAIALKGITTALTFDGPDFYADVYMKNPENLKLTPEEIAKNKTMETPKRVLTDDIMLELMQYVKHL